MVILQGQENIDYYLHELGTVKNKLKSIQVNLHDHTFLVFSIVT